MVVAVLAVAAPAAAHPFGPPPTAQVTAQDDRVVVEWSATPDDAVAIGEELGVMPEGSVAAYRQDAAAQVAPSAADEAALSASPLLHDYLTRNIAVVQDGRSCTAEIPAIPDFVHNGARVVLRCPVEVAAVTLRITMLHDLHPAYRTLAVAEDSDPAQAVFTRSDPEHDWRFGAARQPNTLANVATVGIAAIVALAGAALWRVRRRRRGGS